MKSHPLDEFRLTVVEAWPSDEEAYAAEEWWIEFLRSRTDGFNLSAGGEGNRGHAITDETRAKLTANLRRRWAVPGARERQAELTRTIHTGMKRGAETRERQSRVHKGKPLAPAHRKKLSDATKGKARPDVSERQRGQPKAPEHVEKVAAAHRGMKRPESGKQRMRDAWAKRKAQQTSSSEPDV